MHTERERKITRECIQREREEERVTAVLREP